MRPLEPDDDEWYGAFDLLTMSVVRLVGEAADLRADGGDFVVAITSIATKRSDGGNVLSNSVQTSVSGFGKALPKDLGPAVRANATGSPRDAPPAGGIRGTDRVWRIRLLRGEGGQSRIDSSRPDRRSRSTAARAIRSFSYPITPTAVSRRFRRSRRHPRRPFSLRGRQ